MPSLHFLLTTANLDIHDLKGLVTAAGPGSFTGLRVGLSFAKGLCHALGVPLFGIPSLEAMASQFQHSALPITAILDSRKGEFFAAQFIWNHDNRLIRKWADMAVKLEDFPSLFEDRACFIGNDFAGQGPLIREALGPRALLAPAH
jgi:tRNA threonylcarbamoyladenosine biosynthesis protein TsaB